MPDNSGYGPAWNNLGTAQQALGNTIEALSDYKQAAALGDSLGQENYSGLYETIQGARARNGNGQLSDYQLALAAREYHAQMWESEHFGHPEAGPNPYKP